MFEKKNYWMKETGPWVSLNWKLRSSDERKRREEKRRRREEKKKRMFQVEIQEDEEGFET